jgi:hypothetical protein
MNNSNEIDKNIEKYRSEIKDILSLKYELYYNISLLRMNYENIILNIDQIFFDNIILLNSVINNFEILKLL